MKKAKKIFGGILLVALFAATLVLFFKPYLTKSEEEETTTDPLSIKTPKQLYELGEDMDIEGMVWNVSEAELFEDYEKIDSLYKEQGFLLSREEYVKEYMEQYVDIDLFAGDIRYVRIKCSVTNSTDEVRSFSLNSLMPTSIISNDMVLWYFYCYDVQSSSNQENSTFKIKGYRPKPGDAITIKSYSVQPKESIELEIIGELSLCDIYSVYNLQYSDSRSSNYELYLLGEGSTKRIRLNIAGSFDRSKVYQEARDIQTMKSESWTNLEQLEWEKERREKEKRGGYRLDELNKPISETEEPGQEFLEYMNSGWLDDKVANAFSLITTLTNFQIIEWKDMPSDFAEQGNLQKMAQRYRDIYQCQEEELKVLVLDLNYTSSEFGELMEIYKTAINYFYGRSKLYVKDEENALWLFGTADSWIVTDNSAHPENIGAVNLDDMELDADISVRMAYILPPQLYEQYSALYFTGGKDEVAYDEDEIPITKIALK